LTEDVERNNEMAQIVRKAGVIWNGDSRSGNGLISTESKVLHEQPYSFATRFEGTPGTTPTPRN